MMLSFCFAALVALASAKLPDDPGFSGFETALTVATTDGEILTTQIPGRVVIGRVDTREPATEAESRQNFLSSFDVTIDDTSVCTQAVFSPIGAPPFGNSYGNIVVTTGDVAGVCVLNFTVFDDLRLSSSLLITITVEDVTDLDCILSSTTLTPETEECQLQADGQWAKVSTWTTIQAQAGAGVACEDLPTFQNFTNYEGCDQDCLLASSVTFGECDCDLDSPIRSGTKDVILEQRNNGTECGANDVVEEGCADTCPVDCVLSEFGAFSACSATCAGGIRTRTRNVLVFPDNGGVACTSFCRTADPSVLITDDCLVETETCNDVPCQVATDAPTAAPTAAPTEEPVDETETCENRCGFVGASRRPFLREATSVEEETKQFGRRFRRFRPRFGGDLIRERPVVPECSCDAYCERAVVGESTCCDDIAEFCPRLFVLPKITRPAAGRGARFSRFATACVFKDMEALEADDCESTMEGFYRGCDSC